MNNSFLKHEGWCIAIITVFFYTSTYFFERGASLELNIPLDFIVVSIPTIVNDIMHCSIFLFPMILSSIALHQRTSKNPDGWASKLSFFIYALIYFIPMYYYEGDWGSFALPLFFGFLYAYLVCDQYSFDIKNPFSRYIINISMALFLLGFTFISLGRGSVGAVEQSEFNTVSFEEKTYAILKIYDESVFAWPIENEKVVKRLTHLRLRDISGKELKVLTVGGS